jgi:hypothetical protein
MAMPLARTPLKLDPKALQPTVDAAAAEHVSAGYERLLAAQAAQVARDQQTAIANLTPLLHSLQPRLYQAGDIDPNQLRDDMRGIWVQEQGSSGIRPVKDANGIIINYDPAIWVQNVEKFLTTWDAHFQKIRTLLAPLVARIPDVVDAAPFSRIMPRDGQAAFQMSLLHQVRGLFTKIDGSVAATSAAPALAPCLDHEREPPFPLHASVGITGATNLSGQPIADPSNYVGGGQISLENTTLWDGASHKSGLLGGPFTVRDSDSQITVTANATISQLILFATGVGVAHAWSQARLSVCDGSSEIAAEIVQLGSVTNSAGGTGWFPPPPTHSFGENAVPLQLACSFTRQPGNPTTYVMSVQVSIDVLATDGCMADADVSFQLDKLTAHACRS